MEWFHLIAEHAFATCWLTLNDVGHGIKPQQGGTLCSVNYHFNDILNITKRD